MNSTKDLFIGLDLGGTFIKYALGNSDAQLLIKGKKPTGADQPKEAIFAVIFQAIDELISQAEELAISLIITSESLVVSNSMPSASISSRSSEALMRSPLCARASWPCTQPQLMGWTFRITLDPVVE